jgi:RsiW-degrading membrane proteinase PrsW (M82 family)
MDFILFIVFAVWFAYDLWATKKAVEAGKPQSVVVLTFFLGAPIAIVKWIVSKF